jgi:hypothetical protein
MKAVTNSTVMTALREAMDDFAIVLKEFTHQQLNERVTPPAYMGPPASRRGDR